MQGHIMPPSPSAKALSPVGDPCLLWGISPEISLKYLVGFLFYLFIFVAYSSGLPLQGSLNLVGKKNYKNAGWARVLLQQQNGNKRWSNMEREAAR